MSSVFASNALITGGTITQVINNDGQYNRFRGAILLRKMTFAKLITLLKSAESSDILRQATATAAFHNSKERFDPPNVIQTHAWPFSPRS
jgi:hypothetical protein